MKTNHYHLDLMIPNQANKDVVYNESILAIDSFLNSSVIGFIDQKPAKLDVGEKYVIASGQDKNKICYRPVVPKTIELLTPFEGMILYFIKEDKFFIYHNDNWQAANLPKAIPSHMESQKADKFTGIAGKYCLQDTGNNIFYLYLNDNCEISLNLARKSLITLIIKQNYQNIYELKWPGNILWPDKKAHIMTSVINAINIIRLYPLPESEHFLAEIIYQNYQF